MNLHTFLGSAPRCSQDQLQQLIESKQPHVVNAVAALLTSDRIPIILHNNQYFALGLQFTCTREKSVDQIELGATGTVVLRDHQYHLWAAALPVDQGVN